MAGADAQKDHDDETVVEANGTTKYPISDEYSANLDWSKRLLPEAFDPAVVVENEEKSLKDIFLTTTKLDFENSQKKMELDEFNQIWHNIAKDHELWRLGMTAQQMEIDIKDKTQVYREMIKKSTSAFAKQKHELEKYLSDEKNELAEIEADRLSIMDKIDNLKKAIKDMNKRKTEGERKSEVGTKDFEKFIEQSKTKTESHVDELEQLEKEISATKAEIELIHNEKIEQMFSGTFENASQLAASAKQDIEEKMRIKESQRLEQRLKTYREEMEQIGKQIAQIEEQKQKIHGKSSVRKFTIAARLADVKRLKQAVTTAEDKAKKLRTQSRAMKKKLRDLKEKDLLTPILLEHITNERNLVSTHLEVTLEDLDNRSQELSAVDVEYQRLKTRMDLEKGKTFHVRMKKEEQNLRKEIEHLKEEQEVTTDRMEKLHKQESKIKDELVQLTRALQLKVEELHSTEQNTLKCQTAIYKPQRRKQNTFAGLEDLSLSNKEDSAAGIEWMAHPLQLKFNRLTRTFFQFQEEKAECEVKVESVVEFAKRHILRQQERWDDEGNEILKRTKMIRNLFLMNLEDIPIQTQRLSERKRRVEDTKVALKILKKDISTLQKRNDEKEKDLEQVQNSVNDLKHQYMKILQPQLKKQQKENSKFNAEVKRIHTEEAKCASILKEKLEVEEKLSKEVKELDHDWEEFELERDSATQKIQHLVKQSSDLTGPIQATETDRDMQSHIVVEMQSQQLEESKELSRLRKQNNELRVNIDAKVDFKRKTTNYKHMNETGEWTQLRLKLNKQIGNVNKKMPDLKGKIEEMAKVIAMLEKKVERAMHSAEASKRTEMAKLRKQLKGSVMRTAGILEKQKGLKSVASLFMTQNKGMAGMISALKANQDERNNEETLTKVEKAVVGVDNTKRNALSAFKKSNGIPSQGASSSRGSNADVV